MPPEQIIKCEEEADLEIKKVANSNKFKTS